MHVAKVKSQKHRLDHKRSGVNPDPLIRARARSNMELRGGLRVQNSGKFCKRRTRVIADHITACVGIY